MTVREGHSRRGTPVGGLVRAHPITAFFVLAYLISWVYWLVVLGIMGRSTLFWFVPGAFGPPVAALLVTGLVDGRHGIRAFLRRWVLWRIKLRWYLLALVGIPALGFVVGLPFRDGTERFAGSGPALVVTYLATWSFLAVLGGGQEEPGWRGFALPRMQQRMGPLAASVVLGVLWGLWHLPVFVLVPGYNSTVGGVVSISVSVLVFTAVGAVGQSLHPRQRASRRAGACLAQCQLRVRRPECCLVDGRLGVVRCGRPDPRGGDTRDAVLSAEGLTRRRGRHRGPTPNVGVRSGLFISRLCWENQA